MENSNNEDGFEIAVLTKLSGGISVWLKTAEVGANVERYDIIRLPSSTTRSYKVRAYNSAGKSAHSDSASATTLPSSPTTLRFENDLYSSARGTINWGNLNTVLSLRVCPTELSVRTGAGAYELLQASIGDHNLKILSSKKIIKPVPR
jgi:hypothetical protein